VRFAFIEAEKALYGVSRLCRTLKVSRSGFYKWSRSGPSKRERDDVRLRAKVAAIHKESRKTYGSPRVHAVLREDEVVSRKRVARLMAEQRLRGRSPRRFKRTTGQRAFDENRAEPARPGLHGNGP
jgi:transposase InsO family protein